MKNRDHYILQKNEFDIMMDIEKNTNTCPIRAIAGISRETKIMRCYNYRHEGCDKCVQKWLNEDFSTENSRMCNKST